MTEIKDNQFTQDELKILVQIVNNTQLQGSAVEVIYALKTKLISFIKPESVTEEAEEVVI